MGKCFVNNSADFNKGDMEVVKKLKSSRGFNCFVIVPIFYLNVSEDQVSRIVHCSQFLLNTWNIWECKLICIIYIANTGRKICCVYVGGDICKTIYEGKEDITYLANKFQIRYFKTMATFWQQKISKP